jgi:sugar lactone lactonase YvrE
VLTRRLRTLSIVACAALAAALVAPPAQATARHSSAASTSGPSTFALPDGFQPEGIAISGRHAYFGSRADGSIYRADLRTGRGRIVSAGPGTPSLGLKVDTRGRIFVAGGSGGNARVIDAATGRVLKSYALQSVPAFINDVVLTRGAAWFTDSTNPVLFKVPIGRHGRLPAKAVRIPLTGDIAYTTGNNANGITATPDGRALLIVQSNTGKLFKVTAAGHTTEVDLGGAILANGDGMLLDGRALFVVQNRLNTITKLRLNRTVTSAVVVEQTTDPRFDVPTTIAAYGHRFYLPNARFTTPPTPQTTYDVVAVKRF